MRRILVTGGTGFIGQHLVDALLARPNVAVTVLSRSAEVAKTCWSGKQVSVRIADLADPRSLSGVCQDMSAVFHLAGFAHAEDDGEGPLGVHWRVTVEGTRALLAEAVRAGVSHFLFVSSVKAMGEETNGCANEEVTPAPTTPYGKAKHAAEQLVLQTARDHAMHASVLRLPLVYGSIPKGNLPRMIAAVAAHRFPPVGNIRNQRSMVHVEDVVQALLLAEDRPEAAGKIYLVTDGRPCSTGELYRRICQALGRRPPHWSVPLLALRALATIGDLIGHLRGRPFPFNRETLGKLVGSACYDAARIQRELGYRPRYTLEQTLPEIVATFRRQHARTG